MKRFIAIALAVLMMTCLFAACSKAPAETTDEKVWVIATDTNFVPFEYTDEDGNFVGFDMDLLAAIAEDQGFKYEISILGWDASIAACQAGQADGMIAGASITEERKNNGWIFSDGYYEDDSAKQAFVVGADSAITSLEDLSGKSVAVKNGTASAEYANKLKDQYGFTVSTYESSPDIYQAVISGTDAACVEDVPVIEKSITESKLPLKVLYDTQNEGVPYGLAIFDANNQELVDMFNKGLANIKANGKYEEIYNKYFGE